MKNPRFPRAEAASVPGHGSFSELLSYRNFDEDRNLVYLTAAETLRVGFVMGFAPLFSADSDVESQLEAVLTHCPENTVVQFGVLSSEQTEHILNSWLYARTAQNPCAMLQEMALRRAEYFASASEHGGTLTYGGSVFQPRNYFHYISVTLPYVGDPVNEAALEGFLEHVVDLRDNLQRSLQDALIPTSVLDKSGFECLIGEMLNPQLSSEQRRNRLPANTTWRAGFVDKASRISVQDKGRIRFHGIARGNRGDAPSSDIVATVLTMDAPPSNGEQRHTARLMGSALSRHDRISCRFWLHTTVLIQNTDTVRKRAAKKAKSLNKQLLANSPLYKSIMGHLFEQKEELDSLIAATDKEHKAVRLWMGVVLYSLPDHAERDTDFVAHLWRKSGFSCSPERYISLPVFLAGLPLMYAPLLDPVGKGLQRANTVSSFNAATMVPVQGDWHGTNPSQGGPLLVSRRGQLASIDLFATSTNHNFVLVAEDGSGSLFFILELAADILSRNGVVRIFDVGCSYKRFITGMEGTVLEFKPDNPVSINPFSGIETQEQLQELMPMLKALILQIAVLLREDPSLLEDQLSKEHQTIEQAITQAWQINGVACGLEHVYQWLQAQPEVRHKVLADHLHSFAVGPYAAWLNGPRQIDLTNNLIVAEFEKLEVDPTLQALVVTLMMHETTKDMYLSDPERKRPKLLLLEEGWRLLNSKQSGGFIEETFRTVRKYRGSAGVKVHSFWDFNGFPAVRAAAENSQWQFILKQKSCAIDFAVEQKWLSDDEDLIATLKSINSNSAAGFAEVFIRGETGQAAFRFVVDRHSHWMYTTNPMDLAKLAHAQRDLGLSLLDAVNHLACLDYIQMKHPCAPNPEPLLPTFLEKTFGKTIPAANENKLDS